MAEVPKKLVMLATIHQHQVSGSAGCADLETRLEYLRSKFDVEAIVEEWSDKKGSCAKGFAAKSSLHWANVGTPDEPQFRTYWGLIYYPGHNGTLPHDPQAPSLDEYGPLKVKKPARIGWSTEFKLKWRTTRLGCSLSELRICTRSSQSSVPLDST